MKRIVCIVAAVLVLVGALIFVAAMTVNGWDFSNLGKKFETNTHEINEEFGDISIKGETADILFEKSEDGKVKVVCYEHKDAKHRVEVKDGTLSICLVDARNWEFLSFSFSSPKITVYLPEGEYGALNIEESTGDIDIRNHLSFESISCKLSTGDTKCYASAKESIKVEASTGKIKVEDISCRELELAVSTGDISVSSLECERDLKIKVTTGESKLENIKCGNLISDGSTGDISLKNVIASGKFSIERSTGDVKLDMADAAEIFIITDTGDVNGSLCSDKVFIVRTDTGDIDVPKTVTGGRCEITTDTGDVEIKVNK